MLILKILKWLLIILLILAAAIALFVNFHPVFGGKPDAASLARIKASPNFNGEAFVNPEPTVLDTSEQGQTFPLFLWLENIAGQKSGLAAAV
ncbi:hypothetical protein [Neisseria perflava]|uniref:hypothetical protein n=1 Tax=Neisseria perflava TaxID=33053 RepID=UPI00209EF113|nr:hypothetical protein [Neisseria perflava]MCP1660657.1 hypothetical protein [Neisseria perflava]MCP1771895.1 hypothetical protein [Neisseria perflava]